MQQPPIEDFQESGSICQSYEEKAPIVQDGGIDVVEEEQAETQYCPACSFVMVTGDDGNLFCPLCAEPAEEKKEISLCEICGKRKAKNDRYCKKCEVENQKLTNSLNLE